MITIKSVTIEQLRSLRNAASSAGDYLQAAMCDLAIVGTIDTDEWTTLEPSEIRRINSMSQDEAIAACADVIADAEANVR